MPPSTQRLSGRAIALGLTAVGAAALAAIFLVFWGDAGPAAPDPDDPRVIAGADAAADCAVCHALRRTDAPRVGPPLWDIVGADKARIDGYAYSRALANAEGLWTEAELDAFLRDPHGFLPGTRMVFDGIEDDDARADLVLFLSTLRD